MLFDEGGQVRGLVPLHFSLQDIIRELESREHDFRQQFPRNGLMNSSPAKYSKQYQDARDSRTLHFHNRQYLKSSVKLLTASIRVDWFSLPMEKFLDRMPQLRQGLIKGVFQTKASSPWAGNKSQSIQVSLCLPNKRDLDTWYEAVFALPIAWPDITDIDPHYLKKTSAHQLLSIRMQIGVSHMWGGISPQWHLLKYHLSGYHAGRLEELLIRSSTGRVGRGKMSKIPCCPNHIGKHGRSGKVPKKR